MCPHEYPRIRPSCSSHPPLTNISYACLKSRQPPNAGGLPHLIKIHAKAPLCFLFIIDTPTKLIPHLPVPTQKHHFTSHHSIHTMHVLSCWLRRIHHKQPLLVHVLLVHVVMVHVVMVHVLPPSISVILSRPRILMCQVGTYKKKRRHTGIFERRRLPDDIVKV